MVCSILYSVASFSLYVVCTVDCACVSPWRADVFFLCCVYGGVIHQSALFLTWQTGADCSGNRKSLQGIKKQYENSFCIIHASILMCDSVSLVFSLVSFSQSHSYTLHVSPSFSLSFSLTHLVFSLNSSSCYILF